MPIYGYTCQDCHTHFEVIRPVPQVDVAPPECEHCHSQNTVRKLGTAMAVLGAGANRQVVGGSSCGSCSTKSPNACSGCN